MIAGSLQTLVPTGDHLGVYTVPSSGAWTPVEVLGGQRVWVLEGTEQRTPTFWVGTNSSGGNGSISTTNPATAFARMSASPAEVASLLTSIDPYDIPFTGVGVFGGVTSVGMGVLHAEGTLDRWRFVSAFSTTNVDLTGLVGVGSVASQPELDGGHAPPKGTEVWLFEQTDPDENGCYTVHWDTGVWTKRQHPDVFDPPGNGYRVTCSAEGTSVDGTTFMYIDADPGRFHRVGGFSEGEQPHHPSGDGRWVRFDPVI
jgi:hypothetical protein